jgi:hypothetical protein
MRSVQAFQNISLLKSIGEVGNKNIISVGKSQERKGELEGVDGGTILKYKGWNTV